MLYTPTIMLHYELRWHDGYVIDYRNNAINYDYLFFYEIDENSESDSWAPAPAP